MTSRKKIFIDTSGWIELILSGELYHEKVASYFLSEIKKGSKFMTSDYVLDEAWTRLITQQSFKSAEILMEKIREAEKQKQLLVLTTDEAVFKQSWKVFAKYAEHRFSFTDATIITLVYDFKIDELLTLDQGFKKAGITIRPILDI